MYYFYTTKIAILQFYFNTRNFLYQSFILYEECAKSVKISKKISNITSKKTSRLKLKKKAILRIIYTTILMTRANSFWWSLTTFPFVLEQYTNCV